MQKITTTFAKKFTTGERRVEREELKELSQDAMLIYVITFKYPRL